MAISKTVLLENGEKIKIKIKIKINKGENKMDVIQTKN